MLRNGVGVGKKYRTEILKIERQSVFSEINATREGAIRNIELFEAF